MNYLNMPNDPLDFHLLDQNQCWPRTLEPDVGPGFALLNEDNYYYQDGRAEERLAPAYRYPPLRAVTGMSSRKIP